MSRKAIATTTAVLILTIIIFATPEYTQALRKREDVRRFIIGWLTFVFTLG